MQINFVIIFIEFLIDKFQSWSVYFSRNLDKTPRAKYNVLKILNDKQFDDAATRSANWVHHFAQFRQKDENGKKR